MGHVPGGVQDSLNNWDERFPLVSVILRTYPGDWKVLPRAIASVIAQDLDDDKYELIVVNDGPPTPEFGQIVEDCAAGAGFPVNVLCTEAASGYYCIPSNAALTHCHGAYIAHLDADNEWTPNHLSGLLCAIMTHSDEDGLPHFVYARRRYVRDEGCVADVYEGDSEFVKWDRLAVDRLISAGPQGNFIDSSDFLIGRGTLYLLAERTGCVWNPESRRFGDYDLAHRMASAGFRGRAVDQVSQIYHWSGSNLQLTRKLKNDIVWLTADQYEDVTKRGMLR